MSVEMCEANVPGSPGNPDLETLNYSHLLFRKRLIGEQAGPELALWLPHQAMKM